MKATISCPQCSRDKGRPVHHVKVENCPHWRRKHHRGYYTPMSARRLERYAFHRLVPFWIRWLFGWR